jgi:chromosome segregation ATPase
VPLKRATDSATRAGGAIERFIERTLAPRLEELAGEIRGMRGEMQQLDKRMSENFTSLRNEMIARIDGLRNEVDSRFEMVNTRIDGLDKRIDGLDKRIDGLDKRIDGLDRRVDERLAAIDRRLDERLGDLDEKIVSTNRRFDQALEIRERLASLEAKVEAQKRNGA